MPFRGVRHGIQGSILTTCNAVSLPVAFDFNVLVSDL